MKGFFYWIALQLDSVIRSKLTNYAECPLIFARQSLSGYACTEKYISVKSGFYS